MEQDRALPKVDMEQAMALVMVEEIDQAMAFVMVEDMVSVKLEYTE